MVIIWIELLKFVPPKTRQFVSWKMLDSIILNTAKTRRAIDRNLVHFNIKFDKSMCSERERKRKRENPFRACKVNQDSSPKEIQ